METTAPERQSAKRRFALPLFVAAISSAAGSVALLIVRHSRLGPDCNGASLPSIPIR